MVLSHLFASSKTMMLNLGLYGYVLLSVPEKGWSGGEGVYMP
jgi:hypothetical protein